MPVTVYIPGQLRPQVGNQSEIKSTAGTVKSVLDSITGQYPEFGKRLYRADGSGQVNKFINLYLNQEDVKFLEGLATAVKDGDELMVELAVAGG